MSGSRKTIIAAILACCTNAIATEPGSPPPLGSLLRSGWGFPVESMPSVEKKDEDVRLSTEPELPLSPVVQGPLTLDPVVQAVTPVVSAVPRTVREDVIGIDQVGSHSRALDFEAIQIDSAPSVPRLQPRRSRHSRVAPPNRGFDKQARVIAAVPIKEARIPFRKSTEALEVEEQESTEVCDLVDVVAADSSSTLIDDPQFLSNASTSPIRRTDVGNAEQLPDLDEVASLFRGLESTEDALVGELRQVPIQSTHGLRADSFVLTENENSRHTIAFETVNNQPESWGLIESRKFDVVDSLSKTSELWELAQQQLQQARQAAANGEAIKVRALSLASFRLCLAALDAAEQTDFSTSSFEDALAAIRESKDFCLAEVDLDHDVEKFQQMILEHKTGVLKEQEALSGHAAACRYMTFARRLLVKASKGIPETSEALMLLGAAESMCVENDSEHSDAIAVMLQRAAIEICPTNYERHLALGITLSSQGLREQARLSFQRSVEIRPTKQAYQGLLDLAVLMGNESVLEDLQLRLQQLPSEADTTVVTVQQRKLEKSLSLPGHVSDDGNEAEVPARIGWRAILPFVR